LSAEVRHGSAPPRLKKWPRLENFRLKVFRTVAAELSSHRAAERLFLTRHQIGSRSRTCFGLSRWAIAKELALGTLKAVEVSGVRVTCLPFLPGFTDGTGTVRSSRRLPHVRHGARAASPRPVTQAAATGRFLAISRSHRPLELLLSQFPALLKKQGRKHVVLDRLSLASCHRWGRRILRWLRWEVYASGSHRSGQQRL